MVLLAGLEIGTAASQGLESSDAQGLLSSCGRSQKHKSWGESWIGRASLAGFSIGGAKRALKSGGQIGKRESKQTNS